MKIAELWVHIGAKLDQFNKGMTDAQKAMIKVGKQFNKIGKDLTKKVTLPLLALGGIAIKVGADFEQAMMNAASVSGATGEELKRMEGIARDMGATTVFSAKQAADAMYFMASAGWKVNDMAAAIKPTLDLAAATQSDLAFTTDTVVASLNQFQLGSQGAERLSNVFAAAIGNSQATMEKLSISMRYVGPVFHSMGKSVEEATSVLMGLYNAGYDASMAGTALRMGMVKLMDGTKKTTDALKRLGLSLKEVDPTTHKFADIIELLGQRGAKTKDVIDIFGARAGPAFAALISQGGTALLDFEKKTTGTAAAAKMAEMQINTLKGSFKLLTSALTEAAIQIFQILGPKIKDLVDNKIKPAVQWFSNLSTGTKEFIIKIAGLVAAIGPLLLIFGKLLTILPKIKIALSAVGLVMTALKAQVASISVVLKGLPAIGLAAFAGWNIGRLIGDVTGLDGKIQGLTASLLGLGDIKKYGVTPAMKEETLAMVKLKEIIAGTNLSIFQLRKQYGSYKDVLEAVNNGEIKGIDIKKKLSKGSVEYGKKLNEINKIKKDSIEIDVEALKAHFEVIQSWREEKKDIMELAKQYADGKISLLEYTEKMRELRIEAEKLKNPLQNLELGLEDIEQDFDYTGKSMSDIAKEAAGIQIAFDDTSKKGKKAAKDIQEAWQKAFSMLGSIFQVLADDLGGAIGNLVSVVGLALDQVGSNFKRLRDEGKSTGAALLESIGPGLAGKIGGSIGQLISGAKESFASIGSALGAAVGSIIPGIGTALGSLAGGLLGGLFGKKKKDTPEEAYLKDLNARIKDITNVMGKYGEISEATAKKIAESSKEMTGFAAVSKHLGDVIRDVGVNQGNINELWKRAGDIIHQTQRGYLNAAEGTAALDESFSLLLDGAKELGKEGSAAMVSFILKLRESGLEVKSVTDYVMGQLDRIPDALSAMIEPATNAGEKVGELKEKFASQNEQLAKLEDGKNKYVGLSQEINKTDQTLKQLGLSLIEQQEQLANTEKGTEKYRVLTEEIKRTRQAIDETKQKLQDQIAELESLEKGSKEYDKLRAEIDKTKKSIQDATAAQMSHKQEIERAGILAVHTFNSMLASGISWTDAVNKMKDPLLALRDNYAALGIDSDAALDKLFDIVGVTEKHKELFSAIDSNKIILEALGNSGWLTADAMKALTSNATDYYHQLLDAGLTSNDALRAMGPTLQKLQDYANAYGLDLDDNTKKILDQAIAAGIVKKEQKSSIEAQKKMFSDLADRIDITMTRLGDRIIGTFGKAFGTAFSDGIAASQVASRTMTTQMGNVESAIQNIRSTSQSVFSKVAGHMDTASGSAKGLSGALAGHSVTSALEAVLAASKMSFDTMEDLIRKNKDEADLLSDSIGRGMGDALVEVEKRARVSLKSVSKQIADTERQIMGLEETAGPRAREALAAALAEMSSLEMSVKNLGGVITQAQIDREIADTMRLLKQRMGTLPSFQNFSGSFMVTKPMPIIVHPQERIDIQPVNRLGEQGNRGGRPNLTINVHGVLDSTDVAKTIERKIMPHIDKLYKANTGGYTRSLKKETNKY